LQAPLLINQPKNYPASVLATGTCSAKKFASSGPDQFRVGIGSIGPIKFMHYAKISESVELEHRPDIVITSGISCSIETSAPTLSQTGIRIRAAHATVELVQDANGSGRIELDTVPALLPPPVEVAPYKLPAESVVNFPEGDPTE